jgi:hypothetical protein
LLNYRTRDGAQSATVITEVAMEPHSPVRKAARGATRRGENSMKKAWLLAAVAALALNGAVEAKTLKWGAAREIASLDPYSFGEHLHPVGAEPCL